MFLQKLKLLSPSVVMIVMLLCFSAFAGKMAHAQGAQTVEQAVEDVDAAYQAAPEASPPRKLFQASSSKTKSTKKSSKDFLASHKPARKIVRKTAPQKSKATIDANDLMDGMRESLDPNAQVLVPAAEAPAGQQVIPPISSGKLFQPGKATAKDVNASADALPAVTAKASSAPTELTSSFVNDPFVKSEIPATVNQPVKEVPNKDIKADEPKKDEAKKDAAKQDGSKTGAPLLSELNDAPTGAEVAKSEAASKPAPDKMVASEPTAAQEPAKPVQNEAPGFSKSRPLFSSLSDKRKRPGISRVVTSASSFIAPPMYEPALPPVSEPSTKEPMIKPVPAPETTQQAATNESKKSIWGAPQPDAIKGKVLFSQSADGTATAVVEPSPEPATANKIEADKIFTSAEPEPNAALPTSLAPPATATEQHDNIKSVIDATCGSSNGIGSSSPPKDNLCGQGNATTVIGRGPFMWTCQSADGHKTVDCSAQLQINAVCGSADGTGVSAPPSTNLCRLGLASEVTGNGPYVWSCTGSGGGVNDNCQAPVVKAEVPESKVVEEKEPEPKTEFKDYAIPTKITPVEAKAGNECTPTVKRWTITCQQGGYPSSYSGVIVGETQVLCPTNVERGVWLTNNCTASADSAPVSKSPGKLEVPASSKSKTKLTDMLPDIAPMPAQKLATQNIDGPRKLFTPHYKRGAASLSGQAQSVEDITTINFAPSSEALDSQSTNALEGIVSGLRGDEKSIVTLNAYASIPASGDTQESRRLALARALSARSYLMRKGIPSSRIDVRAVGPASDTHGDDRVDIKVK